MDAENHVKLIIKRMDFNFHSKVSTVIFSVFCRKVYFQFN